MSHCSPNDHSMQGWSSRETMASLKKIVFSVCLDGAEGNVLLVLYQFFSNWSLALTAFPSLCAFVPSLRSRFSKSVTEKIGSKPRCYKFGPLNNTRRKNIGFLSRDVYILISFFSLVFLVYLTKPCGFIFN